MLTEIHAFQAVKCSQRRKRATAGHRKNVQVSVLSRGCDLPREEMRTEAKRVVRVYGQERSRNLTILRGGICLKDSIRLIAKLALEPALVLGDGLRTIGLSAYERTRKDRHFIEVASDDDRHFGLLPSLKDQKRLLGKYSSVDDRVPIDVGLGGIANKLIRRNRTELLDRWAIFLVGDFGREGCPTCFLLPQRR